jgi:fumarate reductase subunit D
MKNAEKELAEIKSMMERSTRFLSLSGLSGVLAGIYALIGATIAYLWIYFPNPPYGFHTTYIDDSIVFPKLIVLALIILSLSIGSAYLLSQKKSKRISTKLWNPAGKRFLQALFIPVLVGGIFCLALVLRGYLIVVAPATLIFYGLALVNASQFTLGDIKYLGYGQLILGIISAFFPGYGLITWALGFGVLHVIYGSMMYYKYDR